MVSEYRAKSNGGRDAWGASNDNLAAFVVSQRLGYAPTFCAVVLHV